MYLVKLKYGYVNEKMQRGIFRFWYASTHILTFKSTHTYFNF